MAAIEPLLIRHGGDKLEPAEPIVNQGRHGAGPMSRSALEADERTAPFLFSGVRHLEQNPLDLAHVMVMCGAPLCPAPIKLLVAEQRAKEAQV